MHEHNCVKCGKKYTDDDVDAYLCVSCNKARKKIADEVNKKIGLTKSARPVKSDLQNYDELKKKTGTPFVHMKDLGITF